MTDTWCIENDFAAQSKMKTCPISYTIRTGKHLFRCLCGCNVFHKPDSTDTNLYQCNLCGKQYEGSYKE